MSNLAGQAKTWAFGKRLSDHTCFNTYTIFRNELRQAFEPPKSEFGARSEFLDLKQGKRDIHIYTQNHRKQPRRRPNTGGDVYERTQ